MQFINAAKPYGVGEFGDVALHGVLAWDGRDNTIFPRKGAVRGRACLVLPADLGRHQRFRPGERQPRTPISPRASVVTLAFRAAGKKVFGDLSVHGGGRPSARAGLGAGSASGSRATPCAATAPGASSATASASLNADVRLRVSHITPDPARRLGSVRASATSAASGSKGETSDTWHNGAGGGIWLSMLNDRLAFSHRDLPRSTEADLIYFKGGFALLTPP